MPVYVRGQSRDRTSQANMGKLFGTNAPGITLNDSKIGHYQRLRPKTPRIMSCIRGADVFRHRCLFPLYKRFYHLNVGYCPAATVTPHCLIW